MIPDVFPVHNHGRGAALTINHKTRRKFARDTRSAEYWTGEIFERRQKVWPNISPAPDLRAPRLLPS